MEHILFVGNPGVGKSSLLNSLIGSIKFKFGVCIGTGLTEVLQSVSHNGRIYTDTPGLDDVDRRGEAAREISKVLSNGGRFKLVFVVTLEEGRVRPSDVATIDAVLTAIEKVGIDTTDRFSVLVNKISNGVMEFLQNERSVEILRFEFSHRRRVLRHMGFIPFVPEIDGKTDVLLEDVSCLSTFIENARVLEIIPNSKVEVGVKDFYRMKDEFGKELEKLQELVDDLATERRNAIFYELLGSAVKGFFIGLGSAVPGALMKGTVVKGAVAPKSLETTFVRRFVAYFSPIETRVEYVAFSKCWFKSC